MRKLRLRDFYPFYPVVHGKLGIPSHYLEYLYLYYIYKC